MREVTAAVVLASALGANGARADDWLLWLPECGLRGTSEPTLRMHYPRPGLPGVVAAGDALVARVQLRAALTPPPGRQQARALSPWGARLRGHAHAAFDPALRRDYRLPVVDVRPDGGSSLVYRVTLAIPSATAPGTYSLDLDVPGGQLRAARAIVVRAVGDPLRVRVRGAMGTDGGPDPGPFALWIGAPTAAGDAGDTGDTAAGQPWLDPNANVAVVRGPSALWRFGDCARPPVHAERTLQALSARTGLPLRPLPIPRAMRPPPQPTQAPTPRPDATPDASETAPAPPPPGNPELREVDGVLLLRAAAAPAELDLTLPEQPGGYAIAGAGVRYFPGEAAGTLAARLSLPAHGRASLRPLARPASPHAAPRMAPLPHAAVGDRVPLATAGLPAGAWTHWRVDGADAGYAQGPLQYRVDTAGQHLVEATTIDAGGRVWRLRATLTAGAARRSGCALGRATGAGTGGGTGAAALWLALWWRRRRRWRHSLRGDFPKARRRE